jgi:hypothetical protein
LRETEHIYYSDSYHLFEAGAGESKKDKNHKKDKEFLPFLPFLPFLFPLDSHLDLPPKEMCPDIRLATLQETSSSACDIVEFSV